MLAKRSVLGLYSDVDVAADTLDALREAGYTSSEYEILTGTPYPEGTFGEDEPKWYGAEIDVDATWTLYGNFELGGRFGFFFPGGVYAPNQAFTVGGELRALVHF